MRIVGIKPFVIGLLLGGCANFHEAPNLPDHELASIEAPGYKFNWWHLGFEALLLAKVDGKHAGFPAALQVKVLPGNRSIQFMYTYPSCHTYPESYESSECNFTHLGILAFEAKANSQYKMSYKKRDDVVTVWIDNGANGMRMAQATFSGVPD